MATMRELVEAEETQTAEATPPEETTEEAVDETASPETQETAEEPKTQEDVTDDSEEETVEPETTFRQQFADLYGVDTQQFTSDAALLESLANAHRAIGKRDDDAKKWRELRDRLGDDGLEKLTAEKPAAPASPKRPPFDQYLRWKELVQSGKANDDIQGRVAEIEHELLRSYYEGNGDLASKLDELAARNEALAKQLEEFQGEVKTDRTQTQAEQARNAWRASHLPRLYADPSKINPDEPNEGLTELGKRFAEAMKLQAGSGDPDVVQWNRAMKWAERSMPKTKTTRQPGKGAQRQPAVAAAKAAKRSIDELVKEQKEKAGDLKLSDLNQAWLAEQEETE